MENHMPSQADQQACMACPFHANCPTPLDEPQRGRYSPDNAGFQSWSKDWYSWQQRMAEASRR